MTHVWKENRMFLKNGRYFKPEWAFFSELIKRRASSSVIEEVQMDKKLFQTALVGFLAIGSIFFWPVSTSTSVPLFSSMCLVICGVVCIWSRIHANRLWKPIAEDLRDLEHYYPELLLSGKFSHRKIQETDVAKQYIGVDLARRTRQVKAKQGFGLEHDAHLEKNELRPRVEISLTFKLTLETFESLLRN